MDACLNCFIDLKNINIYQIYQYLQQKIQLAWTNVQCVPYVSSQNGAIFKFSEVSEV